MAKRSSASRLIIMIVISVALFMGLALGEDYARGFLKSWGRQGDVGGAAGRAVAAVKKYDKILMAAYEQDRPSLLQDVATEHQITEVRLYMTYDQIEKKRRLLTGLQDIAVNKTNVKGKTAVVQTTETWEYHYRDLKTRKEYGRTIETYNVEYKLTRRGSDWLVDSLEAKKVAK